MTSKSPTDTAASTVFDERVSYSSGDWVPHRQLQIPVEDDGFRQGVTAVERLRTYSGRVFAIDAHIERWHHSIGELGIQGLPGAPTTRSLLQEVLDRNAPVLAAERDVGITMFATPGVAGRNSPTHALHLNRLDHQRIDHQHPARSAAGGDRCATTRPVVLATNDQDAITNPLPPGRSSRQAARPRRSWPAFGQ